MSWKKNLSYCCCCSVPVLVITAVCCFAVAIAVAILFPVVIEQQVNQQVTLLPGHVTYEQFLNPQLPVWKSVYFFNLTNPEDFQAGAKPVLKETGPYSYREYRIKSVVGSSVSPDQITLTYTQQRTFHFDPEQSAQGVAEDDVICTINLALVGAVAEVSKVTSEVERDAGYAIIQALVRQAGAHLYICGEATPLVWNYTDTFIQNLHTNSLLIQSGMNLPNPYIQIQINDSVNDTLPSTVYTGVGDINRIGEFFQWDGHIGRLDTWPNGMGTNYINGTEGLLFRPNQKENETLESFQSDVLRSFRLQYVGKVKHLGVDAYRYEILNSTFESAFTNPDNARWGSWCPNGMIYLGPTQDPEVPVFGSKPHFLDGDPSLREKVIGLSPDPSKNRSLYDTVLDVQPTIGANINFRVSLQLNLQTNQTDRISELENINGTVYLPVLYVVEHAELTEGFKDILEANGLKLINTVESGRWVLFSFLLVGVVVSAAFAVITHLCCCAYSKERSIKSIFEKKDVIV